jgi:predicted GIY-YIG superfamily endonuclease
MVFIYVLKLQHNKYYVGKTTNPSYRLDDHFTEGGSMWTKKYKPMTIHELKPDQPASSEQIVTQEYMGKYGIDNVRGGPWCKVSLTGPEKKMITQMIQGNSDACYKCGEIGHFSKYCKGNTKPKIKKTKKSILCDRCGRYNHTADNCFATSDINGDYIEEESEEEASEEEETFCGWCHSEEEEVGWCCSYCDKHFETEKGASYHERFHCKHRLTGNQTYEKSYDNNACKRCGRSGHTKSSCYASTHAKGYELYY